MKPNILVIDDNPDVIKALAVLFQLEEINCIGATSQEQGLQQLENNEFDLVIQDMNFTADTVSGEEGIMLFRQIRERHVDMPIILLTAWANLESAVTLVKAGAADYMSKPWDDDKLVITVKNLIEYHQLQNQQQQARTEKQNRIQRLTNQYDLCQLEFASDAMLQLLEMATQVAHADVPVLITGPNGAGKEKIAEVVQANSKYKSAPFIKVNVGALPTELIEAELFGAEAGAFTGNTKRRIGRFEAANKGTLFLDEIGNLSLEGQKKLLRVLETGEFERLGSTQTQKVQVRVLSATNSDLPNAIAEGQFREDLYYRLNLIELKLLPLHNRKADVLPLAQYFLQPGFQFTDEAERLLVQYPWPGNVRELQNCIKRAMLLASNNCITADGLGIKIEVSNTRKVPDSLSKQDILDALESSGNVVARAAKSVNISRQAFYRRMEKFSIQGTP